MPLEVVLTHDELRWASDVGLQRIALAPGNPRFEYSGDRDGLNTHALGAMAELAFAKGLGLEWPAHVNTFRKPGYPDVFPFWEVRWSSKINRAKVAIDDAPHYLVAHVTGTPPGFEIHGCILAGWVQEHVEAKDLPDKAGKPRGRKAHFIDTYYLTPIDVSFHQTCGWKNGHGDRAGWLCIFCGRTPDDVRLEAAVLEVGNDGEDARGRPAGSAA